MDGSLYEDIRMMSRFGWFPFAILPLLVSLPNGRGDEVPRGTATFSSHVVPFLREHCQECHGAKKQAGGLRLDTMAADLSQPDAESTWRSVLERLSANEMPPRSRPRPPKADIARATDWIAAELTRAEAQRPILRRLNRVEYQNTLRDLLGVEVDIQDRLPEDGIAFGFDNIGSALTISTVLLERYLEAAEVALDAVLVRGPRPPLVQRRLSLADEYNIQRDLGKLFAQRDDAIVLFNSGYSPTTFVRFRAPTAGRYRFRVSAYPYQTDGQPVTMAIYGGDCALREGKVFLVGHHDLPGPGPTVTEFEIRLERLDTIKVLPYGTGEPRLTDAATYKGPGLAVQWADVEGPLFDAWPPESQRRLLGATDLRTGTLRDAERILREFAPRAFRRPVSEEEIQPYRELVSKLLAKQRSFEEALRAGLSAMLCSPDFLYLLEKPGKLDDYTLATRLSYFLWSSMPDAELLALARQKQLRDPRTRQRQVERMLKDAKAKAFTENFVGQWLELRQINFTTPDKKLYPEFDELLQASMVKETEAFFDEILGNDLSLMNFIDADFSMLNSRLAKHYGIDGVIGQEFRRVKLPQGSHRGGVLTQASVLKVSANGTTTSPVLRGKWVLERILGRPTPPPPANVAAIEPDIRGAKTIRDQLAKHRSETVCASCHDKIDPPGFALENFDVIGGWRDTYRVLGNVGKRVEVPVNGRPVQYRLGPSVDSAGVTPTGRAFRDIDEFKKLLLQEPDQIARCLTEKLLIYALGRGLGVADGPLVATIVERLRTKTYGLRTLIHEVVDSEAFLTR